MRHRMNEYRRQEHRQVVELILGHKLQPWQVVHHMNGNKQDNRPANLVVMTRRSHMTMHQEGYLYFDTEARKFLRGPTMSVPEWLVASNEFQLRAVIRSILLNVLQITKVIERKGTNRYERHPWRAGLRFLQPLVDKLF